MAYIKLDYVNSWIDKRNGKQRNQFRLAGFKKKMIRGIPGSAQFNEHLAALLAQSGGDTVAHAGAGRVKTGTIDSVIAKYTKADDFTKGLAEATREMRLPILDHFREHKTPSGRRFGDNRLADLRRQDVEAVIAGKTSATQRNWLIVIRGLIAFGMAQTPKECTTDVSIGIKPIKAIKSAGHMMWWPQQLTMYRQRHALGSMARLALEVMLNCAARRNDAYRLGPKDVTFNVEHQVNQLAFRPQKTLRTRGKPLTIAFLPSLQEALDSMPKTVTTSGNVVPILPTALPFVTNDRGQPFANAAAFGMQFARWCKQAGLASVLCDDGRTRNFRAHGLRRTAICVLYKNGGTIEELCALSGHSSVAQLQVYLQEFNQAEANMRGMMKVAAAQIRDRALTNA